MKPFKSAAIAVCLLPLLAGCISTEPKPCTSEWIDYKSDKILTKFASRNRGLVNDLRQMVRADGEIDPVRMISMIRKADDFKRFADSFQDIVVPELESAFAQCSASEELIPAFTTFLRKEGVSESALEWVAPIVGLMQEMRDQEPTPIATR